MDDVDHPALDLYVFGGHNQVVVVAVLGLEPDIVALAVESLDGYFFAVADQGGYHRAIGRVFVLFDHEEVAIVYVSPDHGLPYPQEVTTSSRTGSQKLGSQRVRLVALGDGFESATGGQSR